MTWHPQTKHARANGNRGYNPQGCEKGSFLQRELIVYLNFLPLSLVWVLFLSEKRKKQCWLISWTAAGSQGYVVVSEWKLLRFLLKTMSVCVVLLQLTRTIQSEKYLYTRANTRKLTGVLCLLSISLSRPRSPLYKSLLRKNSDVKLCGERSRKYFSLRENPSVFCLMGEVPRVLYKNHILCLFSTGIDHVYWRMCCALLHNPFLVA